MVLNILYLLKLKYDEYLFLKARAIYIGIFLNVRRCYLLGMWLSTYQIYEQILNDYLLDKLESSVNLPLVCLFTRYN